MFVDLLFIVPLFVTVTKPAFTITLTQLHWQVSGLSCCALLHIDAACDEQTHTPRAWSSTCSSGHDRLDASSPDITWGCCLVGRAMGRLSCWEALVSVLLAETHKGVEPPWQDGPEATWKAKKQLECFTGPLYMQSKCYDARPRLGYIHTSLSSCANSTSSL